MYICTRFFWKDSIHINDSKAFWKGKVVTLRAMKEYGGTEYIFALVFFWKDSIHINDSKAFCKGKVVTLRAMKEYGGTECIFALVFLER